ncbi:hypothetical protein ACFYMW_39525 [Streptomyces sp. NPDC006692]|uniref:hypothetical protein n=1 Tax=Streptomyces sp. NPDC006692 TaxID=3364758 RepID=UPI00367A84AE
MGLDKPVVLVLFLLRQNLVQEVAADLFGVFQAAVAWRWAALLPVVEKVLAPLTFPIPPRRRPAVSS